MPEVPRFKFIYSGVRVFATEKSHRREIYVAAEGMGTRQKLPLCDFRRISVSQDGSDFSPDSHSFLFSFQIQRRKLPTLRADLGRVNVPGLRRADGGHERLCPG